VSDERSERKPDETKGVSPSPKSSTPAPSGVPWGLAAFLLGVVLLVVFVVQNVQDVSLRFLGFEGEYPLALIIIVIVALTILLDEILGAAIKKRRRTRRAEREELHRLRKQK
jgi:uncharacterized integral membrane protein